MLLPPILYKNIQRSYLRKLLYYNTSKIILTEIIKLAMYLSYKKYILLFNIIIKIRNQTLIWKKIKINLWFI
jgi:hypothetical protein